MQVLTDLWLFVLGFIEAIGQTIEANPTLFWGLAALLVILLIILLIPKLLKAIPKPQIPEIVLSRGEIQHLAELEPASFQLQFNVSNLSQEPIQLLELSVSSKALAYPISLECIHLLPMKHSLDIQEVFPSDDLGERGHLTLYFYTRARQAYRLRAPFEWEPWAQLYKVDPLKHELKATKKLASKETRVKLMQAWREQSKNSKPERPVEAATLATETQPENASRKNLDFPEYFD